MMIRFKKYERPQLIDQSLPSCQIQPADAGDPGAFKNPPQATTASPFLPATLSGKTLTNTPLLWSAYAQFSRQNYSGRLFLSLLRSAGRRTDCVPRHSSDRHPAESRGYRAPIAELARARGRLGV